MLLYCDFRAQLNTRTLLKRKHVLDLTICADPKGEHRQQAD